MSKKRINLKIITILLFSISAIATNNVNAMENMETPVPINNDKDQNKNKEELNKIYKKLNKINKKLYKEYEHSTLTDEELDSYLKYFKRNIDLVEEILGNLKDNEINKNKLNILIKSLDKIEYNRENMINDPKNNINLENNEKVELKKFLEGQQKILSVQKEIFQEYIQKYEIGGLKLERIEITKKNIDKYKEYVNKLFKKFDKQNMTEEEFYKIKNDIVNVWIFDDDKINFEILPKIFEKMKIIEHSNVPCYINSKLKSEFAEYLKKVNDDFIKIENEFIKKNNPNMNLESCPRKLDEIMEKYIYKPIIELIEEIEKIPEKIINTASKRNIDEIIGEYGKLVREAIYHLSLTPDNRLDKVQLHNVILQDNSVKSSDLYYRINKKLNKINYINYIPMQNRLIGLKNKLNEIFEKIQKALIKKFQDNINVNKIPSEPDIYNGVILLINLHAINLLCKFMAYTEMELESNNQKNIDQSEFKELTNEYNYILKNICLKNDSSLDEEKFKRYIKEIGFLNDENINSFKINEFFSKRFIIGILKIKDTIEGAVKNFTEKYKSSKNIFETIKNTYEKNFKKENSINILNNEEDIKLKMNDFTKKRIDAESSLLQISNILKEMPDNNIFGQFSDGELKTLNYLLKKINNKNLQPKKQNDDKNNNKKINEDEYIDKPHYSDENKIILDEKEDAPPVEDYMKDPNKYEDDNNIINDKNEEEQNKINENKKNKNEKNNKI